MSCVFAAATARAQSATRPELRATRITRAPSIDGVLDDEAWQAAAAETGEWLSYDPLYGDPLPQQTKVWITYDRDALYFAFQCDDPDPAGIKTSVTRRDNIWQDDWVGLSLDALGTGQLSYHMMINPSGVQADMLNSVSGDEDSAPDWIWESAARPTPTGYAVEVRLPLQSIRFKGGSDTRMGILFWRRVSRLGMSVSWPTLAPGQWVFERNAALAFDDIQPRPVREVLPSATFGSTTLRATPSAWGAADNRGDVGISGKIGVTPTITVDATLNPDFSQVESDAYQVEMNQRFPVFFSEKRPFFMEGAGIFALAGQNGDSSLRTAVHSRRIVDPIFGAKVTGSLGRVTFASLSAVDESAGRDQPAGSADAGKDRIFNLGRVQYALGPSNYVGAIVTDSSFAGGFNRVIGADMTWRLTPSQRIEGFALATHTHTRAPHTSNASSGVGAQFNYSYETQRYTAQGSVEHYDRDFQMDTAFIKRVGISSGWTLLQRNFYPDKARYGWMRRASFFSFTQGGQDRIAGGGDLLEMAGARFNFTRQGSLRIDRSFGFEPWAGRRYTRGRTRASGDVQMYRWLFLDGEYSSGRAVFYDELAPFAGRSVETEIGTTLQPSGRLSQRLSYNRVAFDHATTGARVYTLHIVNSKTTYQFTRAFSIRSLIQFDSNNHRVLTDFLSSYEPRPGTVVFAGYGSLIEQRDFRDAQWVAGNGSYLTTRRGLFFKASYLYRF